MDAVEAGKLFSFRQKIMKIRQISRCIEGGFQNHL